MRNWLQNLNPIFLQHLDNGDAFLLSVEISPQFTLKQPEQKMLDCFLSSFQKYNFESADTVFSF